jgi:hypothetical protein
MEIDVKNVNYLISRIRDLELQVKLAKNAESAFYNMELKLEDENSRLKELNHELKSGETILKYQDTLGEQQARIKELEEQIQSMLDNYGN